MMYTRKRDYLELEAATIRVPPVVNQVRYPPRSSCGVQTPFFDSLICTGARRHLATRGTHQGDS